MVNTKKSRNAGRGPAPATTLSKLIKKLNEENQPPGGWYELRATSDERRATSVKLKKATSDERRASSLKKLRATSDERQANGASSNKR
jgi:hypothetical protein